MSSYTEEDRMAIAYGKYGDGPWEVIHEEGQGSRRWTETMFVVSRNTETGEVLGIEFERGLTECQEDAFYTDPFSVEPYEETIPAKTVTRWRKVANA